VPTDLATAQFDQISEVYDETRSPLEAAEVEAIAGLLRGWGIRRLLEIGVGTARVALPLAARGLDVTGLDASRRMLVRARKKGLGRLVRGTAYRLPFADRAFDSAIFVHVLHILGRPAEALSEAHRVSQLGVVGLVRPPAAGEADSPRPGLSARRIVLERLRAEGFAISERAEGGPPRRERELIQRHPPDHLEIVSERDVTEPLADQLAMFERRASRWALEIPAEPLARAVAAARGAVGDRTHTYRQVLALARWERPPSPSPGPPGPKGG
jgi:SAM-dependent methyltransferase